MEKEEDLIPVYKRDDSKDYLKVLKALNEIPFPIGKNLLADFLIGDHSNKSISKNNLFELTYFSSLRYEKDEVMNLITRLIAKGLINVERSDKNKWWKILKITPKGQEEVLCPSLNDNNKKIEKKANFERIKITDKDREIFKEFGPILSKYNDEQKKAIISNSNKILCIAGAGSGKTTVLTKRIEFLIKYKGLDPKKILAITFTRKAKKEMEKRLRKNGIKDELRIETFNSFCEKTLRKYEDEIYEEETRVEGYRERLFSFRKALEHIGIRLEKAIENYFTRRQRNNRDFEKLSRMLMEDCFFILEYFKIQNKELYDFSKDLSKNREVGRMIHDICRKLKDYREENNLRSFNDQILDTIKFFKDNKEKIPEFEHVLVDEYQDVNSIQVEILDLLNPDNLFCVGDPRQSIFGWRGSDINYIIDFPNKHDKAEIITLVKNYRSNNHIVKFMNHCIRDLGLPDLEHSFNDDKRIISKTLSNEKEEFNYIIKKIKELQIPHNEIFVLARTNRQLKDLSKMMRQHNIPHILKEDDSYGKKTVKPKRNELVLATVHSIKGMEAKVVFIMGANSSNFPCKANDHPVVDMIKADDYDTEEEERRVFYVAISRAKDELYLTHVGDLTYFVNKYMKNMF